MNKLLKEIGFTDKMMDYEGTLVYNVSDENSDLLDIVIKNNTDEIVISWIVDLQEEQELNVKLVFDKVLNNFRYDLCSSEIQNENDALEFINNIKNTIQNQKPIFLPKQKHKLA